MDNSNLYSPPQTLTKPSTKEAAMPKTGGRGFEIFHNAFRGILAFLFLGFAPVFIVPQFQLLFEEFGIELPTMARLVFDFSNLVCVAPVVFLALSFVLLAAIECGIFVLPAGILKTVINIVYWIVLILVIAAACLTFLNILVKHTTSLASTVHPFVTMSNLTNF